MIVDSSRVQETEIPLRKALSALAGRGIGLPELLQSPPGAAAPAAAR
jgi:hypothetical protein